MEWLQEQPWYVLLIADIETFGQNLDLEDLVKRCRFDRDGILIHAFNWQHTPEGHAYWRARNEELKKFIEDE